MQINNKGWQQDIPDEIVEDNDDTETNRDQELENIAGNLMIAEYQLNKLEQRLSRHIRDIGYRSFNSKKHLLTLSNIMGNGTSFQLK